jgi:microcystin degradation protein MlrC
MNVLIARLNHETNTFSPVATKLAAFGPSYGEQALRDNRGMRTAMAAMIERAERAGATLVTPVSAAANPSGPVDAAAYDELCARIVEAAAGCDAVALDLHGAMVAENSDDGEGDLLARLRAAVGPGVPIAVALDLHANVTQKMIDHADVIVGYKTYPHIDIFETGAHAARLLFDRLEGRRRPVVRWRPLPLMAHTLRSSDLEGAMRRAIEAARHEEQRAGVDAVSVFAGFSLSDIAAPCMSVVAVAENAHEAQAAADRIAARIWAERADFVYRSEPLADAIARAKALAEGATKPVLLLDHGDNCMSGGSCDTTDVLEAALAQGLEGIGVGPICDPQAVALLAEAGLGASLAIDLGNKLDAPKLGRKRPPMRLTGKVRFIGDGEYVITGPTYTGMRCRMGRSVLFDTGAARIVVTERTQEPWDLGVFECVALDPRQERFLLLKSRMYCRPVFGPISAGLVECDSDGVTSSNYALFPFTKLRRPVYPLDATTRFGT